MLAGTLRFEFKICVVERLWLLEYEVPDGVSGFVTLGQILVLYRRGDLKGWGTGLGATL